MRELEKIMLLIIPNTGGKHELCSLRCAASVKCLLMPEPNNQGHNLSNNHESVKAIGE